MVTSREEVTQQIIAAKVQRGLKWCDVAKEVGRSKEWTTAACLGQAIFDENGAQIVCRLFGLHETCNKWLQTVPNRGAFEAPNDPTLYRFREALRVYGPAMKELVNEEFGDGIMSAINFNFEVQREPHEEGDRVKIVWSGKWLPYSKF